MGDDITAVVLAAGMGTRMKSRVPKVLHAVAGRPMVAHVVDAARGAGVVRTIVVVGHGAAMVREAVGGGVETVEQTPQLGSADAVAKALPVLGDSGTVLVLNGDLPMIRGETLEHLVARHREAAATISVLTTELEDPAGYGRIARGSDGAVEAIVEEADASPDQRAIREVNAGAYCFEVGWLRAALPRLPKSAKGEFYLTDLVAPAVREGRTVTTSRAEDAREAMGINTRMQLAEAEAILRDRIRREHMLAGVTIVDPATTYIDAGVAIGMDTVVYPNTFLRGKTSIGEGCEIGPGTVIRDSAVGDGCRVVASLVEDSRLMDGVGMGPWCHVRGGAVLEEGADLGNYAEVKKSRIGARTKMHHFGYIGDADVGADVNVGAGTITCNYDGVRKNRTIVGDGAFIGSDTMLVAPVELGAGAATGAGAVVTKDVPPGMLAVGVPARHLRRRGVEETQAT